MQRPLATSLHWSRYLCFASIYCATCINHSYMRKQRLANEVKRYRWMKHHFMLCNTFVHYNCTYSERNGDSWNAIEQVFSMEPMPLHGAKPWQSELEDICYMVIYELYGYILLNFMTLFEYWCCSPNNMVGSWASTVWKLYFLDIIPHFHSSTQSLGEFCLCSKIQWH